MSSPFLLLCILPLTWSHSFFPSKCPAFPPQQDFDWNKFAENIWFVTQKFDTSSSCLTYKFKTDNLGFKSIEQQRQLPLVGSVGLDHEYIFSLFQHNSEELYLPSYTGNLYAPSESTPAKMIVRFPLNPIGPASFIVLAANYSSSALICTCQDMDLLLTYAHRRSCSILQRSREEDLAITEAMKAVLDKALGEDASHDFDKIDQTGVRLIHPFFAFVEAAILAGHLIMTRCADPDRESAINIDVDRLLGLKEEEEGDYDDVYGDYDPDAELL